MKIKYFLLSFALVCGCTLDDSADETDYDSIAENITKGSPGATNGVGDYCDNPAAPCDEGEGDCDTDAECAGALVCGVNNGLQYGMHAIYDVCVQDHCGNFVQDADETGVDCGGADCGTCYVCPDSSQNGLFNFCSPGCLCDDGQGDCDSDADCMPGLVCGTDNGENYNISTNYETCVLPACDKAPGSGAFCSSTCTCIAGNGDCDNDTHCAAGLVCGNDLGPNFGYSSTTDVCVAPHCTNATQDEDEAGVDCGGADCGDC